MSRLFMIRTCGHERDVTDAQWADMPQVGDEVPCWSSCDNVPMQRLGYAPARIRRVARYEWRGGDH
jgi:hypothetical protein